MKMEKKMDDLVASGLIERRRENASPGSDPDNYIHVPAVTFYKMPEPPPLSLPPPRDEDTSEEDTSEDA